MLSNVNHWKVCFAWASALVILPFALCQASPVITSPATVSTDVRVGFTKTIHIEIGNTGDTPLQISAVKTSCGCVVTNAYPSQLLPGAKGEILVRYTSHPGLPVYEQSVAVFSNDPKKPVNVVKLTGNVMDADGLTCTASNVQLLRVAGSTEDPEFEIKIGDNHACKVKRVTIDPPSLLNVTSLQLDEKSILIHIHGLPTTRPQTVDAILSMDLELPREEFLEIPVSYIIEPRFSVLPATIAIPPTDASDAFTRLAIVSNTDAKVLIKSVHVYGFDGLHCDIHQPTDDPGTGCIIVHGVPSRQALWKQPSGYIEIELAGETTPLVVNIH
jgi:hypothetical protein